MSKSSSSANIKVIIGITIIAIGSIELLKNFGLDVGYNLWDFWPLVFVFIGFYLIKKPQPHRHILSGSFLIFLGGLILLNNLEIINLSFSDIWPIFLILLGSAILWHYRKSNQIMETDDKLIDLSFVLNGGELKYSQKNLKGGKLSAILGGGSIDLQMADMEGSEIVLDIFIMMGGFEIKLPKHWKVDNQSTLILGGIEDKTTFSNDQIITKTIIIQGEVIMGGIEINNK
ncbi:LiaI-LiaF-like domain-containing protein [bacterium]